MHPTLEIFGRTLGVYGIFAVLGLAAAVALVTLLTRKKGIEFEDVLLLMISVGIGMFLGGHILYGITQIKGIIGLFSSISEYTFFEFVIALFGTYLGGMLYYGGFIGAVAGLLIHCHFSKYVKLKDVIDEFAAAVPLFHGFARIGCFFAGCCYGIEWSWGFIVYDNTINPAINGVVRFPVQLFESACNFLIFLALFILYKKGKFKYRLLFVYMLIYPVCRFILDFFRGDGAGGYIFGMTTSQFISILVFAAGIAGLIISHVRALPETDQREI